MMMMIIMMENSVFLLFACLLALLSSILSGLFYRYETKKILFSLFLLFHLCCLMKKFFWKENNWQQSIINDWKQRTKNQEIFMFLFVGFFSDEIFLEFLSNTTMFNKWVLLATPKNKIYLFRWKDHMFFNLFSVK